MEKILNELVDNQNIRANLSALRQNIKELEKKALVLEQVRKYETLYFSFLKSEDAKTRKNAALLLGDLAYQNALEALYEAYVSETTLFVKASYLQAIGELDAADKLPALKEQLSQLLETSVETENKKHIDEEIRALRKIVIQAEGIRRHTPDYAG